MPSEDFKNRKYILIMVAQPIFDLKSIDFTPKKQFMSVKLYNHPQQWDWRHGMRLMNKNQ